MVKYHPAALTATYWALADATRRALLERLAREETSVTALAEPFQISLPAVSKHLRILEEAKLLARTQEGRISWCRFEAAPLKNAGAWLEQFRLFWENRLDALAAYLEEKPRAQPKKRPAARKEKRVDETRALSATFNALCDPTRRKILTRLMSGPALVTELAEPFDMSLPAVSKHLRVLENAGLMTREKEGRMLHCQLLAAPMQTACAWIARYQSS